MADSCSFPPSDNDLAYVSFKDVSWLQTFGLDASNVMDYFSLSQFFDRSCNNQVVRMQFQFNPDGRQASPENISSKLKMMTGTEYEVAKVCAPRLFVIHKQDRKSSTEVALLASYYILDGCIYQSPSLYTTISHRVLSSMAYLQAAIIYAETWLQFDPTKCRYSIKPEEQQEETMPNVPTSEQALKETSMLHGAKRDKIDFITSINTKFMNLPQ